MNEREREVYDEARKRLEVINGFEGTWRGRARDDLKFVNADAYNQWQWPADISALRSQPGRPKLTINKTRQHCLQILNDARQNKPSVKIIATGGESSAEAAQTFEDVVRRIEYNSNAEAAYMQALDFAVKIGIGYWYVTTDYADDNSFDQEIFIRPIRDPFMVAMDPGIKQIDGSDARYAFIYTDLPRAMFESEYPSIARELSSFSGGGDISPWITRDSVRLCEYYRVVEKKVKLIAFQKPDGTTDMIRMDELKRMIPDKSMRDALLAEPTSRVRQVKDRVVEWYKFAGNELLEKTIIPCTYIPIVRIIGEETIIEGQLDRKGHVRAMIDPQRMYNYQASAAVETTAMQNIAPYTGPIEAIEGFEEVWKNANVSRPVYLPYRAFSETGQELPAPQRQEPPTTSDGYVKLLMLSQDQLESVSGQREAMFGQSSNDQSGVAINQLQQRGDNSTFHYLDNWAIGVRFTGKILIDMIPRVYDTERVIKIRAEDGTERTVKIDPQAPEALQEQEDEREAESVSIFNPSVGKYDVQSSVGPAYQTKRREMFNAMVQVLTSPSGQTLIPLIGDMMFRAADFPHANEAAERLRRAVPPNILGEGPTPAEQQLQEANAQLQQLSNELMQALADKSKAHEIEEQQKQIDVYKATTDRLGKLLPNLEKLALLANGSDVAAMTTAQSLTEQLPQPMQAEHAMPDIGPEVMQ